MRRARLPHAGRALDQLVRVVLRHAALVVVDADEVDRRADVVEVGGGERRPRLAEQLRHRFRILAEEDRIEILPVHVGVGAGGGGEVLVAGRGGDFRLEIDHQSDLLAPAGGAIRLHGAAVRAQEIVRRERRFEHIAVSRR